MPGDKRIVRYRSRGGTCLFDLEIEADGKRKWRKEEDVQCECASLLYDFWEKRKGRGRCLTTDLYHVFEILEYDLRATKYRVHWVGYPSTDATWESAEMVQTTAPALLSDFWRRYWREHCAIQKYKIDGRNRYAWGIGWTLSYTNTDYPFRKGPAKYTYAHVTGKDQEIVWSRNGTILRWSKPEGGWHVHINESYEFLDDKEFQVLLHRQNGDDGFLKTLGENPSDQTAGTPGRKRKRKSCKQQVAFTAASAIVNDV